MSEGFDINEWEEISEEEYHKLNFGKGGKFYDFTQDLIHYFKKIGGNKT